SPVNQVWRDLRNILRTIEGGLRYVFWALFAMPLAGIRKSEKAQKKLISVPVRRFLTKKRRCYSCFLIKNESFSLDLICRH
ncbi:hypothetical protein QQ73_02520, partial [Candidatus Endoriftia persephone str. Guaymas]|nr:hypothetical protein [Candidatus Endoriftia persephone str. Guaymas]